MLKKALICVDDEEVVLEGLNSQLGRHFGKEHLVEMAQSGEEALELVDEFLANGIEIPVLVTDQIMPGMKGSTLLSKMREINPATLCIMLTGQAGADEVGDAVNQGNLYRYLAKPWDRQDLILTITEALKSYDQKREIQQKNQQLKEYAEKLEEKVKQRTAELRLEKERTERLLLSILPEETAAELKAHGASPPRSYMQVTVLFTDFVGFSAQADSMSPVELVSSLEECFNVFDEIVESHNLEKIKTIGDAYMCAGGIPEANTTNALDAVHAALEMNAFVSQWNLLRAAEGKAPWEIRIGIHTGELVAGVIGTRKFAYDVWGDAVNVASRMESHGQPGRINISQDTYELVREYFRFEDRGEIKAKGKGLLKMYFVESKEMNQQEAAH